jgi:hypothetical protein
MASPLNLMGENRMKWLVMVPVLALGACATEWKKPGASPQELNADSQACQRQAEVAVPVRMITIGGYMTPAKNVCESQGVGSPPVCHKEPGEMVPPTLVDQNLRTRDAVVANCLKEKGWAR